MRVVIERAPSLDLERASGERLPALLEDLPLRRFEAVEGDVSHYRRTEIVLRQARQRPLRMRPRHDQHVASFGLAAPHEVQEILQVGAVPAEGPRLELA